MRESVATKSPTSKDGSRRRAQIRVTPHSFNLRVGGALRCHKQPMRLSARRQNVGAFLKRRKQQFLLLRTWLDVVFSQHEVRCRSSDRCKLEHKWEIGVKCIVSWQTKRHQKEGRERHDLLPSWCEGSQSNTLYRTTASLIPGLKQVSWYLVVCPSLLYCFFCGKR